MILRATSLQKGTESRRRRTSTKNCSNTVSAIGNGWSWRVARCATRYALSAEKYFSKRALTTSPRGEIFDHVSRLPHSVSATWLLHPLPRRRPALVTATMGDTALLHVLSRYAARSRTSSRPTSTWATVNVAATQRTVGQVMGIDCPPGVFTPEVVVKYQKRYEGTRTNLGSAVIQLTKDEHDAIVCMLFKTEPWQIGKSTINSINKAAKAKGKDAGHEGTPQGHRLGRRR